MITGKTWDRLLWVAAATMTMVAAVAVLPHLKDGRESPGFREEDRVILEHNWTQYTSDPVAPGVVRIVVFSDYLCPYCENAFHYIQEIKMRFPEEVEVSFRHLPVFGRLSRTAAYAAECARMASRFSDMSRVLYQMVDSLGLIPWTRIASMAGVQDTLQFVRCLEDSIPKERIAKDMYVGRHLGINGTPALLVDSLLFYGDPGAQYLEELIEGILSANVRNGGSKW